MIFEYLHGQVLRIRIFNEMPIFIDDILQIGEIFFLNHSQYVSLWSQITFSLTFSIIKKIVPYDF